jgi:MFS family permease
VAPPRGEPEKVAMILVVASAVAVAGCAVAPNYVVALGVFALAGAASATLFTATLAVRAVYSPPQARAQVYVSMGGVKMAGSGAGITALALAIMLLDRRLTATPSTSSATGTRNSHP